MVINSDDIVGNAMTLARKYHAGQKRFDGSAYVNHPIRVYELLKKWGIENEFILAASLLHDTKEDTEITDQEIIDKCGIPVLNLIKTLTFDKNDDYLQRCDDMPLMAKIIKLADIIDNITDLAGYRGYPYRMLEKKMLALYLLAPSVAEYFGDRK